MFLVARKSFACYVKNESFEGISLSKQGDGVLQVELFTKGGHAILAYVNTAEAEALVVYLKTHGLIGKEDLDKLLAVINYAEDY